MGLTAVQYALRLGALVYATAGKEVSGLRSCFSSLSTDCMYIMQPRPQDKRDHLLQMGVKSAACH